ncbi:NUDIX hydrolase [uncultured Desulfosarcina sp.]|uniref:NUDIX hydrolase n=1 Tax=uncultured Desulfosarcina sp. TaxID=218289 RepID=UPI0029C6F2EA|nr:NUDIX hydrolase [uncultured Desulfosarcina sp.]
MMELFDQAGAIPYRILDDAIEVLLISTSSGKNLTIPKGLIDPGYSATETVVNEAYEEAGIKGRLLTPAIGAYEFEKWGGRCRVDVFVMAVNRQLEVWPEGSVRRRVWFDYHEAARRVKHADLGDLILKLPAFLNRPQP